MLRISFSAKIRHTTKSKDFTYNQMNQNLKILLLGIGMSPISYGLMTILFLYLPTTTMYLTSRYIIVEFIPVDWILAYSCPIIIALVQIAARIKQVKVLIKNVLWTLGMMVMMIFIGMLTAIYTWKGPGREDSLIPEYYRYQPFKFYWTVFIVLGILISAKLILLYKDNGLFKVEPPKSSISPSQ